MPGRKGPTQIRSLPRRVCKHRRRRPTGVASRRENTAARFPHLPRRTPAHRAVCTGPQGASLTDSLACFVGLAKSRKRRAVGSPAWPSAAAAAPAYWPPARHAPDETRASTTSARTEPRKGSAEYARARQQTERKVARILLLNAETCSIQNSAAYSRLPGSVRTLGGEPLDRLLVIGKLFASKSGTQAR